MLRGWNGRVTRSGHIPLAIAVLAVLQFTHALHVPFWANLLICAGLGLLLHPVFRWAGWTEPKNKTAGHQELPG